LVTEPQHDRIDSPDPEGKAPGRQRVDVNRLGLLAVGLFAIGSVAWAVFVRNWSWSTMGPATIAVVVCGGWFAFQLGRGE
jgi:CHASE2 domain-containing sensor protein